MKPISYKQEIVDTERLLCPGGLHGVLLGFVSCVSGCPPSSPRTLRHRPAPCTWPASLAAHPPGSFRVVSTSLVFSSLHHGHRPQGSICRV